MVETPPPQRATLKETLVFYAKLAAMLAGFAVFGFAVFWARKSM